MTTTDYLTFEKWEEWYQENQIDLLLPEVHTQYSRMSESEYLLAEFLSYPLATQKSINSSLRFKFPSEALGAVNHLMSRLSANKVSDFDWYPHGLETGLDFSENLDPPSEEFVSIIRVFYKLQRQLFLGNEHSWYSFGTSIPKALRLLYGEEKTMSAIRIWIDHASHDSCEFGILIELLKDWEELSCYPPHWAFSVASKGDRAQNSSDVNSKNNLELNWS